MTIRNMLNLFLLSCCLMLAILLFMIFTPTGLQWSYKLAQHILPGQLQIEQLHGTLRGPLHFKRLTYHSATINVEATGFHGDWKPTQLINSRFTIQQLHFDNVSLQLPDTKQTSHTPRFKLDLPIYITIKNLSIDTLHFQQGNSQTTILKNISLIAHTEKHMLILDKLSLQHNTRHFILDGTLRNRPLQGKLNLSSTQAGKTDIVMTAKVGGSLDSILFSSHIQKPVLADINAHLYPDADWQFNLAASWKDLNWPFNSTPDYSSPAGRLTAQGDINNYDFSLATQLQGNLLPVSEWKFTGTGNTQSINFKDIKATLLDGQLKGRGQLQFSPDLAWHLQLQAEKINLAKQWANIPGVLNFSLATTGQFSQNNSMINLVIDNINGQLFDNPIQGYAKGEIKNNTAYQTDINLSLGRAWLKAKGSITNNNNLQWDIAVPDLHTLLPAGNGQFTFTGSLLGTREQPNVNINLKASQLSWQHYQVSQLTAQGNINLNTSGQSNFSLAAQQLQLNAINLNTLNINLNGKITHHTVIVKLNHEQDKLNLVLQGRYATSSWQGKLTNLTLDSPNYTHWSLTKPARINANQTNFSIKDFCWAANPQSICGNFAWQQNTSWSTQVVIKQFALQQLNYLVNKQFTVTAPLDANINLIHTANKGARGKATVSIAPGIVSYNENEQAKTIHFNGARLTTQFTDTGMLNQLNIKDDNENYADVAVNFPGYFANGSFTSQQATQGHLQIKFQHLSLLPLFIPDISQSDGQLAATANWNGSINNPRVKASLAVSNGQFDLPNNNVSVTDITIRGNTINSEKVSYQAQAMLGKGLLKLTGNTHFSQAGYPTHLNLAGNNLTLSNRKDNKIIVSPDLTVVWEPKRFAVTGQVLIPSAIIYYRNYIGTVTLPSDTIIINAPAKQTNNEWLKNFYAKITLILGDDVKFYVGNLVGKLTGQLTLNDVPNKAATGTGEIRIINGSYIAFGQTFIIQNGRLLYAGGALDNPGLNIRATKQINSISTVSNSNSGSELKQVLQQQKVTVGILMQGTLQHPKINLFSDPAGMSQADILSYLVLGYSVQEASTNNNGQALWQALNTLQVSGDDDDSASIGKIKQELQNMVGLDELTVQSGSYVNPNTNQVQSNTSLKVGKNITKNLSVGYSLGLLSPINTISATYQFLDNWMLSTTSNSLGTGADLIYTRDAG